MAQGRSPVHTLKISISGVRGVVGESLTPQLLVGFSQAFGCWVDGGVVIVGRDTRQTGEMVRSAVVGGLLATGCYVIDAGIVPVPTLLIAVKHQQADGGVAITASHNPEQWNALKFVRSDGVFLSSYQATELLDIYHQGQFALASVGELTELEFEHDAIERHINLVLKNVDVAAIKHHRPKVVVDACNGAGSVMTERLLTELGCDVTMIHDTPDGRFPHPPEPIPRNLGDLCQAVHDTGADIGFAQDADADRLAVVSEKGIAIGEEFSLAFACDAVAARTPGPIVVNVSTSRMIDDVARRHKVPIFHSKVGEINVVEGMIREGASIGGEGNGGVVYPPVHMCRDSMSGIAVILQGLVEHGSVTAWTQRFPPGSIVKTTIECPSSRIQHALTATRRRYSDQKLDETEGVKVIWPDTGAWLHIRPSNTEPVIRVIAETDTEDEANGLCQEALETLNTAIEG